ncbi:hypothetical protein B0H17DRAFT_1147910 [Mycena rosella]|uniref:Uncharacterized protein n=1 Tax=Mycena rosella TaxID=1033263 RepID=A0AAD7CH46_MYCRO|nr:hypothetical protein B0H17DRAFT_1147910 [Mycena rosella]
MRQDLQFYRKPSAEYFSRRWISSVDKKEVGSSAVFELIVRSLRADNLRSLCADNDGSASEGVQWEHDDITSDFQSASVLSSLRARLRGTSWSVNSRSTIGNAVGLMFARGYVASIIMSRMAIRRGLTGQGVRRRVVARSNAAECRQRVRLPPRAPARLELKNTAFHVQGFVLERVSGRRGVRDKLSLQRRQSGREAARDLLECESCESNVAVWMEMEWRRASFVGEGSAKGSVDADEEDISGKSRIHNNIYIWRESSIGDEPTLSCVGSLESVLGSKNSHNLNPKTREVPKFRGAKHYIQTPKSLDLLVRFRTELLSKPKTKASGKPVPEKSERFGLTRSGERAGLKKGVHGSIMPSRVEPCDLMENGMTTTGPRAHTNLPSQLNECHIYLPLISSCSHFAIYWQQTQA